MNKDKPQECGKLITDDRITPHDYKQALCDLEYEVLECKTAPIRDKLMLHDTKLRARVEGYAESYDILAKERNDLAIRVRELEAMGRRAQ